MILITGNRQDHIWNDSYQEKQVSSILTQSCHPATLGHLPGATRSKVHYVPYHDQRIITTFKNKNRHVTPTLLFVIISISSGSNTPG